MRGSGGGGGQASNNNTWSAQIDIDALATAVEHGAQVSGFLLASLSKRDREQLEAKLIAKQEERLRARRILEEQLALVAAADERTMQYMTMIRGPPGKLGADDNDDNDVDGNDTVVFQPTEPPAADLAVLSDDDDDSDEPPLSSSGSKRPTVIKKTAGLSGSLKVSSSSTAVVVATAASEPLIEEAVVGETVVSPRSRGSKIRTKTSPRTPTTATAAAAAAAAVSSTGDEDGSAAAAASAESAALSPRRRATYGATSSAAAPPLPPDNVKVPPSPEVKAAKHSLVEWRLLHRKESFAEGTEVLSNSRRAQLKAEMPAKCTSCHEHRPRARLVYKDEPHWLCAACLAEKQDLYMRHGTLKRQEALAALKGKFVADTALDVARQAGKATLRSVKRQCGSCGRKAAKHKATMTTGRVVVLCTACLNTAKERRAQLDAAFTMPKT